MAKAVVYFTAQFNGRIVLDVPEQYFVDEILNMQSPEALFAACQSRIITDITDTAIIDEDIG